MDKLNVVTNKSTAKKPESEGRKSILQFIKFGLVGISNTLIDLIVSMGLNALFSIYYLAKIVGYCCGILNSYLLNTRWTFKEERKKDAREIISFIGVNLVVLAVSTALMYFMKDKWGFIGWWESLGLPNLIVKVINGERFCMLVSAVICIIINFIGNKLIVFNRKDTEN